MKHGFEVIFARLRNILEPYAGRLEVAADKPEHYGLAVAFSPKLKKGFPVAWVKVGKAYVSYHFMPVYMFAKLRESMSPLLKARMQGKSCFNFKVLDEEVFKELENLTAEGLAISKKEGFALEA